MKKTLLTAIFFVAVSCLQAAPVTGLEARRVASNLPLVLYVTAPPGDTQRLFIVRQTGQIHILNLSTGKLNATPFLNINSRLLITDEQGLVGMAFDPNYGVNGKFYLDFVVPGGKWGHGTTHVSQFQATLANPDIADAASAEGAVAFRSSGKQPQRRLDRV